MLFKQHAGAYLREQGDSPPPYAKSTTEKEEKEDQEKDQGMATWDEVRRIYQKWIYLNLNQK